MSNFYLYLSLRRGIGAQSIDPIAEGEGSGEGPRGSDPTALHICFRFASNYMFDFR